MHALERAGVHSEGEGSPHDVAATLDQLVIGWCITFFELQRKQSPAADFNPSARLWFAAQLNHRRMLRQMRECDEE